MFELLVIRGAHDIFLSLFRRISAGVHTAGGTPLLELMQLVRLTSRIELFERYHMADACLGRDSQVL